MYNVLHTYPYAYISTSIFYWCAFLGPRYFSTDDSGLEVYILIRKLCHIFYIEYPENKLGKLKKILFKEKRLKT